MQELFAAFHIVHRGTGEQEKVFKGEAVFTCPIIDEKEVMLGGRDCDIGINPSESEESEYEELESGRSIVAMFVSGLRWTKTV